MAEVQPARHGRHGQGRQSIKYLAKRTASLLKFSRETVFFLFSEKFAEGLMFFSIYNMRKFKHIEKCQT